MKIYLSFEEKTYRLDSVIYFSGTTEKPDGGDECGEGANRATFKRIVNDVGVNAVQAWLGSGALATLTVVCEGAEKGCRGSGQGSSHGCSSGQGVLSFSDVRVCSVTRSELNLRKCEPVVETVEIEFSVKPAESVMGVFGATGSGWQWRVSATGLSLNGLNMNVMRLQGGNSLGNSLGNSSGNSWRNSVLGAYASPLAPVYVGSFNLTIRGGPSGYLFLGQRDSVDLRWRLQGSRGVTNKYDSTNSSSVYRAEVYVGLGEIDAFQAEMNASPQPIYVFVFDQNSVTSSLLATVIPTGLSPLPSAPFVWQVTCTTSNTPDINMLFNENGSYDLTIDWGDGGAVQRVVMEPVNYMPVYHTYSNASIQYTAIVWGTKMTHWGVDSAESSCEWMGIDAAKYVEETLVNLDCYNSDLSNNSIEHVTDGTWASNVTSSRYMFVTSSFKENTNGWMRYMTKVKFTNGMFLRCNLYNNGGAAIDWQMPELTTANAMFANSKFNQDISSWYVPKLQNVTNLFKNSDFNQNINTWNTPSVEIATGMFDGSKFDNSSAALVWSSLKLKEADYMFNFSFFNQNINGWAVPVLETGNSMFANMSDFNNNGVSLSWNTPKLTTATNLFQNNSSMVVDVSSLEPPNVANWLDIFDGTTYMTESSKRGSLLANWEDALSSVSNVQISNIPFSNCLPGEIISINNLIGKSWTISGSS